MKLHKHTLNLFAGDWQALKELYPELKTADVVRNLVRKHIEDQGKIQVEGVET